MPDADMGLVTPLGVGNDAVWQRLLDGQSGASRIERFDTSDLATKIACQIPRGEAAPDFNADDWMPQKEQRRVDEFIVFGMGATEQALDDAGWKPADEQSLLRTGVLIGSGIGGLPGIEQASYTLLERGPRRISPFFIPGSLINLLSGHVSIKYGFKGPNHAVVTACSTGAHGVGRHRPARIDAAGTQALDGRGDNVPVLGTEVAVLAGVRVQAGDGKAGRGDAIVGRQGFGGDTAVLDDQIGRQRVDGGTQGDVNGDGHRTKAWAAQHHNRRCGDAAAMGQILGVTGMFEAGLIE